MRKRKKIFTVIASSLIGSITVGLLYHLFLPCSITIFVAMLLFSVLIRKVLDKKKFHDRRFEECGDYLEQMIFAFEMKKEILTALRETKDLFVAGEMKQAIEDTIDFLEESYSGNSKVIGLQMIEEKFPSKQIKTLHNYMIDVEKFGGDSKEAFKILREDTRRWRLNIALFQEECKKQRRNIVVAILVGVLLCASLIYLTPDNQMLLQSPMYQWSTTVMCILNMLLCYMGLCATTKDWIKDEERYTETELEDKMLRYLNHTQRIGRKTLHKILGEEIMRAYPEWMLSLSLLLQNRDVPGAIEESRKGTNKVLGYYILEMVEKIHDYPDSPKPYLEFMQEFQTPESVTAMKMLYAISSGNCAEPEKQITQLLERTQVLAQENVKGKQSNMVASMYALFLAPTLLASLKLVLDMSVLMLAFIGQLSM